MHFTKRISHRIHQILKNWTFPLFFSSNILITFLAWGYANRTPDNAYFHMFLNFCTHFR